METEKQKGVHNEIWTSWFAGQQTGKMKILAECSLSRESYASVFATQKTQNQDFFLPASWNSLSNSFCLELRVLGTVMVIMM